MGLFDIPQRVARVFKGKAEQPAGPQLPVPSENLTGGALRCRAVVEDLQRELSELSFPKQLDVETLRAWRSALIGKRKELIEAFATSRSEQTYWRMTAGFAFLKKESGEGYHVPGRYKDPRLQERLRQLSSSINTKVLFPLEDVLRKGAALTWSLSYLKQCPLPDREKLCWCLLGHQGEIVSKWLRTRKCKDNLKTSETLLRDFLDLVQACYLPSDENGHHRRSTYYRYLGSLCVPSCGWIWKEPRLQPLLHPLLVDAEKRFQELLERPRPDRSEWFSDEKEFAQEVFTLICGARNEVPRNLFAMLAERRPEIALMFIAHRHLPIPRKTLPRRFEPDLEITASAICASVHEILERLRLRQQAALSDGDLMATARRLSRSRRSLELDSEASALVDMGRDLSLAFTTPA